MNYEELRCTLCQTVEQMLLCLAKHEIPSITIPTPSGLVRVFSKSEAVGLDRFIVHIDKYTILRCKASDKLTVEECILLAAALNAILAEITAIISERTAKLTNTTNELCRLMAAFKDL